MDAGQELLSQSPVFRCDPKPSAVTWMEIRSDIVKIRYCLDVQPRLRNRNNDVNSSETQRHDNFPPFFPIGSALKQQIFTGDADVNDTLRDFGRNFRRW